MQERRSHTALGERATGSTDAPFQDALAAFQDQYTLGNGNLYQRISQTMADDCERLLIDIGGLMQSEMASLREVQANQQHQVAELFGQVDETMVRVAAIEKELNAQGRRVGRRSEGLVEARGSLPVAQKTIEQLRKEAM